MIALLLLIAANNSPADAAIAHYQDLTDAAPACGRPDGDDIVVCGRRAADRYRAPLVVHDPGDPMHEGVSAERDRLLARTSNCAEHRAALVGCGFVGVTTKVGAGGVHFGGERPLAP